MTYATIKNCDFINEIIKYDNIDTILEKCKTQSEKGFIFERLWDIIIKFGFCTEFPRTEYVNMYGNVNNGKLKKLETFTNYLKEKVISGNSGGSSDITLLKVSDNTYIFLSSKLFISSDDAVDQYGIEKINSMIADNKHIYLKFKIYLLVQDKKTVLGKVKTANISSNHITKYMTEDNILDKNDLNKYFLSWKEDYIKNKDNNLDETYLLPKDNLILRFHQKLIVQKTIKRMEEGYKSFLWGCKPRSGKTYMVGGIIIKLFENNKKLNVLIITPAPTETTPQFTEDLFCKFKDFNNITIHSIKDSTLINNIKLGENNIFVVSKQLLQKYINENTIEIIKNLNLDIIVFDENHFSGTSELSKSIIKSYLSKNTVKIYLTATYNKPLREWNIPIECQYYWDIEDEQICKSILSDENNISKLNEKYGDEITSLINDFTKLGISINDIFTPYKNMPDQYMMTTMFNSDPYNRIKELIKDTKYGFSFESLFALNDSKTKFKFESEVMIILRYISGSNKEQDYPDGDKSFLSRIKKICRDKDSRMPFTMIMFLPSDGINEISKCLKNLMTQDKIFKRYDVLCINRKNNELAKDVKEEINKYELIAKSNGKEGLILLAGNMLSLGITLHKCDVVFLMNNVISSDKIFQQMYRCMTEASDKKCGFVVDLNISRVLNTCINYSIYKKDMTFDSTIRYLIENHLINIDIDMIDNKEIDSDRLINKLIDIWKGDPINNMKNLLRKLDDEPEDYDNATQELINKIFTKSLKDNNKVDVKVDEDNDQELPSGKETIKEDASIISDNTELTEIVEINKSFTKDALKDIIPLLCILTMRNSNTDFIKMLNDVKDNPYLLDIFDEQCKVWWNRKDLINIIKEIVSKYFNKNSNPYNIANQFKMSLQSLIDKPKELLELIEECLKPKLIEKKDFGEVFTSMIVINDMLDKLPKDVWKNKNLKWLDPSAGMGNFPIAVYLRLMNGLDKEIPDAIQRKKHILENMLYMCEINKKNVLIMNQIIDINNEYKLNIHQGDFLEFNSEKIFMIKEFDIILGNPPFQEKEATGDNKLYLDFTKICLSILKQDKYLLFITPTNIMDYLLLVEKNRKYINNLYQLKYLAIETINKYFPNVNSTFMYFLLEKKVTYEKTVIEYMFNNKIETTELLLEKGYKILKVITKLDIEIIPKITSKTSNYDLEDFKFDNKTQRIRKEHFTKNVIFRKETDTHKIKIIDTINKTDPFPGKYYYYNKKDNVYSKDKLVLSKKGYLMPTIDRTKLYTYSDSFKYIIEDNNGSLEQIKMLLDSNIVKYLISQYSKNGYDSVDIIKMLYKKNLTSVKDNNDLYKLYGLTDEHSEHINNILKINKSPKEVIKKDYEKVKYKRKNYYLDDDKVYIINKDKSKGELFGNYIEDKVVQLSDDEKNKNIIKKETNDNILKDDL